MKLRERKFPNKKCLVRWGTERKEVYIMCQMKVVITREMLGTREVGWSLWDGKQLLELTTKQIMDSIKKGKKVCGLKINNAGTGVEVDKEGFYCQNVMEHRHCGNYQPMIESESCMANLFYICIGSHEEKGNTIYDCISTKFEQAKISESDMRAYLKIGIVSAGAKLDGDKIVLASLEFEKKEESKTETKVAEKATEPVKAESKPIASAPTKGSMFGKK